MDCAHRLVLDDDNHSCTMDYESVIGRGRIEILPEEEKYDALVAIMAQYHEETFPFSAAVIPKTTVFKLTVEQMTGKKRKKK